MTDVTDEPIYADIDFEMNITARTARAVVKGLVESHWRTDP